MLKTRRGSQVWLVTQPAHAELSGFMAAHWGNDEFCRPGSFAPCVNPERLRQEVVLAVAEHDNGWWEWEADPALSDADGLPQGLAEVLHDPIAGMQRWRIGIPRLAAEHPYASLLIGDHAYWLYASQFDPNAPLEFVHELQRRRSTYPKELEAEARVFLSDVQAMQGSFTARLESDALWRSALQPEHRNPHTRLLQTLDAFSLALCSTVITPLDGEVKGLGEDHVRFHEVPRRSWEDRVSIDMRPAGAGQIVVDPYPFDETPLLLAVPARLVEPKSWWRKTRWVLREYTLVRP